jgi:hypothetical protein
MLTKDTISMADAFSQYCFIRGRELMFLCTVLHSLAPLLDLSCHPCLHLTILVFVNLQRTHTVNYPNLVFIRAI